MQQIANANYLADSKRTNHSSLLRLKSTQIATQMPKQSFKYAHCSLPTLSEPSFQFEGSHSHLHSFIDQQQRPVVKLNHKSNSKHSSSLRRYKYNIAVMGESREDKDNLIRQLMKETVPNMHLVDEFDIDLNIDSNISIKCCFTNTF